MNLITLECGCQASYTLSNAYPETPTSGTLEFCPLHAAAEQMREALYQFIGQGLHDGHITTATIKKGQQALTHAQEVT